MRAFEVAYYFLLSAFIAFITEQTDFNSLVWAEVILQKFVY